MKIFHLFLPNLYLEGEKLLCNCLKDDACPQFHVCNSVLLEIIKVFSDSRSVLELLHSVSV